MKWLVYGCGLLISSAAFVALSMSGVFPALGGIGSGLLTVCVYFLGVYLAPRLIIHRLQQRVSKEKPEDIVTIEPNRKPVRRDVVGYQLAIFILVCATVLLALRCGSASAEVDGLQKSNIATVMKKAMQMPKVPLMKAAMMPGVKMATAPAMPTEMLLAAVQSCLLITMSCASSAMVPVSSRKKAIVITTMAAITLQGASIGYTTPSWQNIKAILPALIVGKMGF